MSVRERKIEKESRKQQKTYTALSVVNCKCKDIIDVILLYVIIM